MHTIVKVIEVIAQSATSWDDAAQSAIREASKTISQIKSVWVDNFSAEVEGDRIVVYRVNAKISFLVEARP